MAENGQNPIVKEKCSVCGYDKHRGSLHIHHKDNNHNNNNLDNLQVLCANCHMELHQKDSNKRTRRDAIKEKSSIIQDLNAVIEDVSYEKHMYEKAHFNDLRKIVFYQEWLYKHIDNATFREIQNEINRIESET